MGEHVKSVFRQVIDDVLSQAKEHVFIGLDQHTADFTIQRLRSLWESHLNKIEFSAEAESDNRSILTASTTKKPVPSSRKGGVQIQNVSNPYENPVGSVKIAKVEEPDNSMVSGKRKNNNRASQPGLKKSKTVEQPSKKGKSSKDTTKSPGADKQNSDEEESDSESDFSSLGSDLDDDEEEDVDTENMILCQYTKVHRVKNRWRCQLKDGIIRVRGANRVFKECSGEFEF